MGDRQVAIVEQLGRGELPTAEVSPDCHITRGSTILNHFDRQVEEEQALVDRLRAELQELEEDGCEGLEQVEAEMLRAEQTVAVLRAKLDSVRYLPA